MNAKQRATWEDLVRQCESRSYSSINVASKIRSDAVVAAGKLVGLVGAELPALLERLATHVPYTLHTGIGIATQARNLATKIREVLDGSQTT